MGEDEWWRLMLLIDGFNKVCSNIYARCLKFRYKSMSTIQFHTTPKGKLTHLSYILRKPELLGKDFKTVACSVTLSLIFLEIQRG